MKRIFLSHADTDRLLAGAFRDELCARVEGVEVFVSSLPGAIPTGSEWLSEIKHQLKAADAYVALLTPASVERQWVWFESGAAFMSNKPFVGICACGLRKGAVPSPLSGHQLLSFDSPEDCAQVFKEFGAAVDDDEETLWDRMRAAAAASAQSAVVAAGWLGVSVGSRFFAWQGPIDALDDKDAVVCPPGLEDALRAAGMTPTFGNSDRLDRHLADGRLQVFLTDQSHWKRPITNSGKQLLLVHGTRHTTESAFDAARRLQQRTQAQQRRAVLLHTEAGVRAAGDEFYRLADAVDAVVKQLPDVPLDVERFAADWSFVIRYARRYRSTVQWILSSANSLEDARLVVAQWQGHGGRVVQISSEKPLDRNDFRFDVSPEGHAIWRHEPDDRPPYTSVGLADWCVASLLNRAASSE